jgi:hypothetical protein
MEATNRRHMMFEVAYRIPGQAWKRREFASERAFDRFVEGLEEKYGDCIEFRWAD